MVDQNIKIGIDKGADGKAKMFVSVPLHVCKSFNITHHTTGEMPFVYAVCKYYRCRRSYICFGVTYTGDIKRTIQ